MTVAVFSSAACSCDDNNKNHHCTHI